MANFGAFAHSIYGGMRMNAADYWQIFMDTGAPEMYLMYHKAKRQEDTHVLDNTGPCTAGLSL